MAFPIRAMKVSMRVHFSDYLKQALKDKERGMEKVALKTRKPLRGVPVREIGYSRRLLSLLKNSPIKRLFWAKATPSSIQNHKIHLSHQSLS